MTNETYTRTWDIVSDTEPNTYRFYPLHLPKQDYGIDHLIVWVAPTIQKAYPSNDLLDSILYDALLQYAGGAEMPLLVRMCQIDVHPMLITIDIAEGFEANARHGH